MNKKGQGISLDFVFGVIILVVLVILAIVLIVNIVKPFPTGEEEVSDIPVNTCNDDEDCYWDMDTVFGCLNNTCVEVDCRDSFDCNYNKPTLFSDWEDCVNYECVSYMSDCHKLAREDYNMSDPTCRISPLTFDCLCEDYIIDSPRKEIEKENSIQIIEEKGHYTRRVRFQIKNEKGEKNGKV